VRFSAGHGAGARYKCWLIADVNQKFRAKFGFSIARQLVVMPSASDFVGMKAINTGELDSFMVSWEYLKKQRSAIHLIDGTFLGSFTHAMTP
jgi:metallophosphoesterase superfamily enzyme